MVSWVHSVAAYVLYPWASDIPQSVPTSQKS